jgi:hypothetical protein
VGTYNLTGVTQITITVGAAGSGSNSGGTTKVVDAQTHGHRIQVQSAGGSTLTGGTRCAFASGISTTLSSGTNPRVPILVAGGTATPPSGINLQSNTKLMVNGGSSEPAYAIDIPGSTQYSQGGRGGATYPSTAGPAGGSVICPSSETTYCSSQTTTPLVPGSGAGGGAISVSSGTSGSQPTAVSSTSGGVGAVIIEYA